VAPQAALRFGISLDDSSGIALGGDHGRRDAIAIFEDLEEHAAFGGAEACAAEIVQGEDVGLGDPDANSCLRREPERMWLALRLSFA
jgi:hypothetical protein